VVSFLSLVGLFLAMGQSKLILGTCI
jgi:hypothetical protein